MNPLQRLPLLDVWREACRHIEIEASAQKIARILTDSMPIDQLRVIAFDFQHELFVPRATGKLIRGRASLADQPRPMRPSDRRLLEGWGKRGEVLVHHRGDDSHDVIRLLAGPVVEGDWLAGPLINEQGITGALLLRAHQPEVFGEQHQRMVESLLEPFSAALENDRRMHELNALRETAEADTRSALSRLGRDDLASPIVGSELGLKGVMERVSLVARSDVPVIILGETGSGKEVIARAIHEQSSRSQSPFIRVNCGAIPAELIDSELFGHEKGAFTGASALRRGWFERADQGTLLLDEIGELTLPAQVRLLRVLQEGTFERVGAEKAIRVNVRIVAATHRDLPAMIQQGRFREDLWYRIAGFPILLPPLRERRHDIPDLATHFAQRAARKFGLRYHPPAPMDLQLLAKYDWPGNIRELASVIDRAAILGQGQGLEIAKALGGQVNPEPSATTAAPPVHPTGELPTLDQAMNQHIQRALQVARGRIEGPRGAAALLDINPHTLRARMRKLGLDWQRFRE